MNSSVQFSNFFLRKDITMTSILLSLWIMAWVEVQCFRTPLGTGFQDGTQDDELSGQGIFHLLGNAFKYAFETNDSPLEPEIPNIKKLLERLAMYGKSRLIAKNYGEKRCLPGWPGWPGCNFL